MTLIWLVIAFIAVASAVMVIRLDNPVHSALSLVVTLLCIAAFYALLIAPFVAIVQVAVYAGAIMVLFLFVIMLLNLTREEGGVRAPLASQGAALVFGLTTLGVLLTVVAPIAGRPAHIQNGWTFGSPEHIGLVLFQQYLLPFEIVSLLLTVAMVGAILLARRKF